MKCVYCAEEIQDEAIICRFCGSRKIDDVWRDPQQNTPSTAISFTFRFSGFLFLISAFFEIFGVRSPILHFGGEVDGFIAMLHHLLYFVLFLGMGIGVRGQKKWGPQVVYASTAIYVLDRIVFLVTGTANIEIVRATSGWEEIIAVYGGDALPLVLLQQSITLIYAVIILCWVGFAGYVYWKRKEFTR